MRKINKIMMMTVAILLSLVLITSSVVSGTLAKYTTSSSASDSARVAKWGVTVEASETLPDGAATIQENVDGIDIKITSLPLAPGTEYPDAIHFKVDGDPEVAIRLKIIVGASFENKKDIPASFLVPSTISGLSDDVAVIPFGFTFGLLTTGKKPNVKDDTVLNPGLIDTGIGTGIITGMTNKIKVDKYSVKSPRYCSIDFYPNSNSDIVLTSKNGSETANEFYFGFYWPLEYTNDDFTKDEFDAISTWLMENREPYVDVTFTVSIEQINS